MSEENNSPVAEECEEYIKTTTEWIGEIESKTTTESRKGVADRFIRDCKLLIEDINKSETPSSADLVDFQDKFNSMEIRYHTLISNI